VCTCTFNLERGCVHLFVQSRAWMCALVRSIWSVDLCASLFNLERVCLRMSVESRAWLCAFVCVLVCMFVSVLLFNSRVVLFLRDKRFPYVLSFCFYATSVLV
jgi:hypothetical protein